MWKNEIKNECEREIGSEREWVRECVRVKERE